MCDALSKRSCRQTLRFTAKTNISTRHEAPKEPDRKPTAADHHQQKDDQDAHHHQVDAAAACWQSRELWCGCHRLSISMILTEVTLSKLRTFRLRTFSMVSPNWRITSGVSPSLYSRT